MLWHMVYRRSSPKLQITTNNVKSLQLKRSCWKLSSQTWKQKSMILKRNYPTPPLWTMIEKFHALRINWTLKHQIQTLSHRILRIALQSLKNQRLNTCTSSWQLCLLLFCCVCQSSSFINSKLFSIVFTCAFSHIGNTMKCGKNTLLNKSATSPYLKILMYVFV